MTPPLILAALLALAVALGWARLILWQRAAPIETRAKGWRLTALLLLQPVTAALLYLTLMPPPAAGEAGRLVVATRDATPAAMLATGERLVLLPEARTMLGGERVPDLATALRRHPDTRRLLVLGEGLVPRDLPAAEGLAITFNPAAPSRGLIALGQPAPVAPGAGFDVGGEASGLTGGWAELLDPSGTRVARQRLGHDGRFRLAGTARAPGLASFTLRLRDGGGIVEDATVPLRTEAETGPRVLLIAGAPGPEPKFLRRWAADAGVAMRARMSAGGGIQLGDAAVTLTAATLAATDLVVLDDRAWATLSVGERAALVGATRDGMGLMLRATGPLPVPVAAQWRALGFATGGGREGEVVVSIPPGLPLHVLPLKVAAPDAVPLLRDGKGVVLARWRALGRGRVGLWTPTDSFALALAGHADRYGELWSAAFATLARGAGAPDARIDQPAWAQSRLTLCGLSARADIVDPSGTTTSPVIDPASGASACAAYWPTRAGWHRLRTTGSNGKPREQPFLVLGTDALPTMRATMTRDATLRLAARGMAPRPAEAVTRPGSPWLWFVAWLAAAALLWWLERARFGRRALPA